MGTLIALYVGLRPYNSEIEQAVRARYPRCEFELGDRFLAADMPIEVFEPPERELCALSKEFGVDVIWLTFQSVVDAFQFHHWRAGSHLRSLTYGCEEQGLWGRIEGVAERWESEAIFPPEGLANCLEFAESDNERREFERIWREADLKAGECEPTIDARETARKVANHYLLPGWD